MIKITCKICGADVKNPNNPKHIKSKRHQTALTNEVDISGMNLKDFVEDYVDIVEEETFDEKLIRLGITEDEAAESISEQLQKEGKVEIVEKPKTAFDTIMEFLVKTKKVKAFGLLKNTATLQSIMQGTIFEMVYGWDTFTDDEKDKLKDKYYEIVGANF